MMTVDESMFKLLCRNYCANYEGIEREVDLINLVFALEMLVDVNADQDLHVYALEVLEEFR